MSSLKGEWFIKHLLFQSQIDFFFLKKKLNILYVVHGETISIPGTQCGLANEHTSVTAVVKEGKSSFSSFKSMVSIRPYETWMSLS
jgi:hypothetical protein